MTRPWLLPSLFGLFALLGACASPVEGAPRRTQAECAFGEGDVVPLQGGPGLVALASVNGQPLRLEVSTGLGLSSLLPDTAQRLGLPEDPHKQSGYAGPSGPVMRRNALTRSLRIGGQEWSGRSLAVRPFYGADGGAPAFDGELAADLLRETELEIDLPARRLAFHRAVNCRPGSPPWAPATSTAMEVRGYGVPVIAVRVNGQPVRARIHSGNNVTALTPALAERLVLGRPTGQQMRSYGSDPVGRRSQVYQLDEVAVGEEVSRGLRVVISTDLGEEEMVLGQDWLARRKVWLSYANRRLFLAPPGN